MRISESRIRSSPSGKAFGMYFLKRFTCNDHGRATINEPREGTKPTMIECEGLAYLLCGRAQASETC